MNDLNDPFNPKSGEFAKNIRAITGLDDTELRKSLEQFGWIKELPAIADENGVVLVGSRRMRLAKQLNIEPVITLIKLGKGDEADAYRLKLAIASNLGHQPLTRDDRKRIAEYLYGQKNWTMEQIAKALEVSHMTIVRDLKEFEHDVQTSRPKGGRPKENKPKPKKRAERQPQAVEREEKVAALHDAGLTASEIADKVGLGLRAVHQALEHVEIKREAATEVEIDPTTLSLTAQEKLDAAMRQHQRKLDAQFEKRVLDEISKRMDEMILPHWREQIKEAKKLYDRRKGIMDKPTYRLIRSCLHIDSRLGASEKKFNEAFNKFEAMEKYLLNEKDSATEWPALPDTAAEWDKMRAKRSTAKGKSNISVRAKA